MVEQDLSGNSVAEVLGADKAGRVHRDHPDAQYCFCPPADSLDVFSDKAADAGAVDEYRLRPHLIKGLPDGVEELLFGTIDNIQL
jgi:hypothetical protein